MTDDGPILEPIGRGGPSLVWVGGLAVVLVAVVGMAIGGRLEPGPSALATGTGQAAVASAAATAPARSPLRSPAPIWYRPSPWPMGEDGLAGGTVYSSPSPSPDPSPSS
jgi:hypothetical protein